LLHFTPFTILFVSRHAQNRGTQLAIHHHLLHLRIDRSHCRHILAIELLNRILANIYYLFLQLTTIIIIIKMRLCRLYYNRATAPATVNWPEYCRKLVKENDYEGYLATLSLPQNVQWQILAVN
jgi:hypothetical protein